MQVTFRHGINTVNTEIEEGTSVEDVIGDATVTDALRVPENFSVLINGATANRTTVLRAGDIVVFERAAAQKA